ncbi:hypothetical protein MRX96_059719 [Rhipicephalus microplus]
MGSIVVGIEKNVPRSRQLPLPVQVRDIPRHGLHHDHASLMTSPNRTSMFVFLIGFPCPKFEPRTDHFRKPSLHCKSAHIEPSINSGMAPTPVVGYTTARGLAQSIRNLLVYKGVHFEDKRYEFGPAPTYEKLGWAADSASLGFTFPNLPYYIDGDVRLTQSLAILPVPGQEARSRRQE